MEVFNTQNFTQFILLGSVGKMNIYTLNKFRSSSIWIGYANYSWILAEILQTKIGNQNVMETVLLKYGFELFSGYWSKQIFQALAYKDKKTVLRSSKLASKIFDYEFRNWAFRKHHFLKFNVVKTFECFLIFRHLTTLS